MKTMTMASILLGSLLTVQARQTQTNNQCQQEMPAEPATGLYLTVQMNTGEASGAQERRLMSNSILQLVQDGECSRRIGPFATQDTAWARQRGAKQQGYSVSGVFPCYDQDGYRGYCFNVFYRC
jgi:hypothetical protein